MATESSHFFSDSCFASSSFVLVWIYAGFRANQEYYEYLVKKGYRDSNLPPQPAPVIAQETPLVEEPGTNNANKSKVGDKVKMVALATFVVLLALTGIAVFAPSESDKSTDQDSDNQTTQASAQGEVKSKSEQKEELAKQESEKKWLDSVAKTYCDNHKKTDFKKGHIEFTGVTKEHGSQFTLDDCKKIISYFKDLSPKFRIVIGEPSDEESIKKVIEAVAEGKIQMNMSIHEVAASWGTPDNVNTTTTQFGENQQWIYGDVLSRTQYVYLDGEETATLKVTSWQDF